MYVNVHLTVGTTQNAFLVPQAGLQRDSTGPYVLTVGGDGKVAQKRVVTDTVRATNWVITKGLTDGDRIIVSGVQNARPGAPATVTSDTAAPAGGTPAAGR